MSRRLAQWKDEQGVTHYGIRIKPFWLESGTYGYQGMDKGQEKALISMSIKSTFLTLANTIAALSVSLPGTLGLIPFAFLTGGFLEYDNWLDLVYGGIHYDEKTRVQRPMTWPERIKGFFKYRRSAHGFSGVFNVIAGYLAYHAIFNKDARKIWLPLVGASGTMVGNLFALKDSESAPTNQYAHFGGYAYGFLFASLVHRFLEKKTHGVGLIRRYDIPITIIFLVIEFYQYFFDTAASDFEKKVKQEIKEGKRVSSEETTERIQKELAEQEERLIRDGYIHPITKEPLR